MKIYHVETQQDYDALMIELEEKGCKWSDDMSPTEFNGWESYQENTYVKERDGKLTYGNVDIDRSYPENYSEPPLIEYKAKGGKQMLNTECKHCHEKCHHDNAKYCSMCGNKLVDEPEFKAGDIVSSEILPDGIGIVRLEEDLTYELSEIYGIWYTNNDCEIQEVAFVIFKQDTRHATPEEVAEYKVALTFHKHGRKPFEVKRGDILRDDEGNILRDDKVKIFSANYPKNVRKNYFTCGRYTLLKTAEEVNEWIRGE